MRRPSFLERDGAVERVVRPAFGEVPGGGSSGRPRAASESTAPSRLQHADPEEGDRIAPIPASQATGSEEPTAGQIGGRRDDADLARLEGAIERLRLHADRLAAEMRADALELALLLARKLVEGELTVNVDRVIAMARSAVRRLGESRRIVVRLAPADAEAIQDRSGARGGESLAGAAAQVEIVVDPTLSRGDCVVEGDLVAVDGRLETRLAELRRVLAEDVLEEPR